MNCEGWRERLIDLATGELDEVEAIRLEQHLTECSACLAEQAAVDRIIEGWPTEDGPSLIAVRDRVLSQAREEGRFGPAERARSGGVASASLQRPRWARIRADRILSRRIPAYAAAILVVAAGLIGLWAARHYPPPGDRAPVARSDRSTHSAPATQSQPQIAFAAAPEDAVSLTGPAGRDTL